MNFPPARRPPPSSLDPTVRSHPVSGRSKRLVVFGLALLLLQGNPGFASISLPCLANATAGQPSTSAPTAEGHSAAVALQPGRGSFTYGFDYGQLAPEKASGNNADAVTSAQQTISKTPSLQVQAIMGWGPGNPEPSPGVYNFTSLDKRISLITATNGTPVIDLAGAPDWMKGGKPGQTDWSKLLDPPTPAHYADFAKLAANIASRYPQVHYFVVWKELHGFFDKSMPGPKHNQLGNYDMRKYTDLYNQVYRAIKAVRPDAKIGGPYAAVISHEKYSTGSTLDSPQGSWGYVDQRPLDAIMYWVQHKVGGDFLALDGPDFAPGNDSSSPLNNTLKFRAVGRWLSARTTLPIWYMESAAQPRGSHWPTQQAAAVRIAAMIRMREGEVTAGMQWQPVSDAGYRDLGLVTNVTKPGGGHATPLAPVIGRALPILQDQLTEVTDQPSRDVLVATNSLGTIALNAGARTARAKTPSGIVTLAPGAVLTVSTPCTPVSPGRRSS